MCQRLQGVTSPAVGVQYHTPTQQFFRNTNARGRWASDPGTAVTNTAYNLKRHADGTVDCIRLEADFDGWYDLGGQGAYDCYVGRI